VVVSAETVKDRCELTKVILELLLPHQAHGCCH
jgi:hypothetical protein